MPRSVFDDEVTRALADARRASREPGGRAPFPSPGDWRAQWVYFLLLDRFHNPAQPPRGAWDRKFGGRHGGTFAGVTQQLGYLQDLGVKALWLSPVLKNARPDWEFNYHGYGIQDFLVPDERFASDGTRATAERELRTLVDAAHERGLHVILDVVLNHSGRVFDYLRGGQSVTGFSDPDLLQGLIGGEPDIEWLNGFGLPRSDWRNTLPPPAALSPDDAVWPAELQRAEFFRRRGSKVSDRPDARGFVRGDFDVLRQLVVEYDATAPGQEALREELGIHPVLSVLIRAHQYLIARYDVDGFRIDTVKYVDPEAIETFGNAIREFAHSIGKHDFFTFGEVYDDEETIARFVGRNGGSGDDFGIDAALDFPLFYKLPRVAKRQEGVEALRDVFLRRKAAERDLISTHGDAGRYFVSFLDNHDQHERIQHPLTPAAQVDLALTLLFTLQGIPCVYYGTEQSCAGTIDGLDANESTREALWGKPGAFDRQHPRFRVIRALSDLRAAHPALAYGRLYFREVSGNGVDFGHSWGAGGIVAYSRILVDEEVLVTANTGNDPFDGAVIVDRDLNRAGKQFVTAYSTVRPAGDTAVVTKVGAASVVPVRLEPSEARIWV